MLLMVLTLSVMVVGIQVAKHDCKFISLSINVKTCSLSACKLCPEELPVEKNLRFCKRGAA